MQLIVLDDDPLTREMVVASARAHGIDAIPAATISEADALLDEAAGEIAILSDVDLRCAQTGIEASLEWAKALDGSRILLMSGHLPEMIEDFESRPDGSVFLQKPFGIDRLVRALDLPSAR